MLVQTISVHVLVTTNLVLPNSGATVKLYDQKSSLLIVDSFLSRTYLFLKSNF